MPTSHQFAIKLRTFQLQVLDHIYRDATHDTVLLNNRVMLIGLSQQDLKTRHIGRVHQTHNALAAIGKILHQLHQPLAHGKDRAPRLPPGIQTLATRQPLLIDGMLDPFKLGGLDTGKQHRRTHTAQATVRSFTRCGDHGLVRIHQKTRFMAALRHSNSTNPTSLSG